jgi:hypothetical protein
VSADACWDRPLPDGFRTGSIIDTSNVRERHVQQQSRSYPLQLLTCPDRWRAARSDKGVLMGARKGCQGREAASIASAALTGLSTPISCRRGASCTSTEYELCTRALSSVCITRFRGESSPRQLLVEVWAKKHTIGPDHFSYGIRATFSVRTAARGGAKVRLLHPIETGSAHPPRPATCSNSHSLQQMPMTIPRSG